jgi:hypothetical protein
MDFNNKRQASKILKKGQIIKVLALKQKVKCHFMKWGDCVSKGGKHYNDYFFSFSTNKFQFFLSPK